MSSPKTGWQQALLPGGGVVLHSLETLCTNIKGGVYVPLSRRSLVTKEEMLGLEAR